jgi:Transposase
LLPTHTIPLLINVIPAWGQLWFLVFPTLRQLRLKPLPAYSYLGRMLLLANNCQSQMLQGPCGTLTSGAQVFAIEAIESQHGKRQYRRTEEKRRIVEETLAPEASVAMVARRHGLNANRAFHWRRLYQAGLLGTSFAEGESSARNGKHRAIIAA